MGLHHCKNLLGNDYSSTKFTWLEENVLFSLFFLCYIQVKYCHQIIYPKRGCNFGMDHKGSFLLNGISCVRYWNNSDPFINRIWDKVKILESVMLLLLSCGSLRKAWKRSSKNLHIYHKATKKISRDSSVSLHNVRGFQEDFFDLFLYDSIYFLVLEAWIKM